MSDVLLNNVSTNTVGLAKSKRGGPGVVIVRGDDYGGGTVNIEMASVNDINSSGGVPRWAVLTDGAFTTNGQVKIDYLAVGTLIRAVLTGSTSPDDIYVELLQ